MLRFSLILFLPFLLSLTAGAASTVTENEYKAALASVQQSMILRESLEKQPGPQLPKGEFSQAEMQALAKEFVGHIHSVIVQKDETDAQIAKFSITAYRYVITTQASSVADEVLLTSKADGQALMNFFEAFQRAKLNDSEISDLILAMLQGSRQLRKYFTVNFDPKLKAEIAAAMFRAHKVAFLHLVDLFDVAATESRPEVVNQYGDDNFRYFFRSWLSEARKMPGVEAHLVAQLQIEMSRLSMSAQSGLIAALAGSAEISAYRLVSSYFNSPVKELRARAYSVFYLFRQPESTFDLINEVTALEQNHSREIDYDKLSGITNKIAADLDRGLQANASEDERVSCEKMRKLIFSAFHMSRHFLKTNLIDLLTSRALTDAEVDEHLMAIATDSVVSLHWSVPYIISRRNMSSLTAIRALELLVNDPDPTTAKDVAIQLNRIQSLSHPKSCDGELKL